MSTFAPRSRESNRVALFAVLLGATVSLLLAFAYLTVVTQHAAGITAQGQAIWVQSHTRGVMHLRRYARTGATRELASFDAAVRAPLAFKRARLALQRPDRDIEQGAAAFIEGGLPRPDAERLAQFGKILRYVEPGREAIAAWARADAQIDSLQAHRHALREAWARGDSAGVWAIVARVDAADAALVQTEREFSALIADASRRLPPLMLVIGVLLAASLITAALITFHRVARAAEDSRRAERDHFLKLHALMEAVPDVISWYDRSHRITYVNAALEALTGIARDEMVGLTHDELARRTRASRAFVDAWEEAIGRAFAGERDVSMVDELPTAEGRHRWVQLRFAAQRDVTGAIDTVVAIGRDITAIRESEAALRERDAQLRHAQKLEAVGRLAGGVAHEFNNILTAVTANVELALLSLPEDEPIRQDLLVALTAARRAGGLTRQLLVFGRRDPGDARRVDVGRLVTELEVMLQRLAGDKAEIVLLQSTASPIVMADAGQLQQILLNLVSNARDAMPGGGTVQIEIDRITGAELEEKPGLLSADADPGPGRRPEHEWVTLSVRDTGSGMSLQTVDRILEPFFTTKGPGAGSGLGLPVVNGIVLQLGGRIHLETAPGAGSRFTIALPAAPDTATAGADGDRLALHTTSEMVAAAGRTAPGGRGEVVMLVEDEAPVRSAARRMLEKSGYIVVEAKHAEDALMLWRDRPADIVVTDFVMPGLNGGDLIARLRADHPDLPALIVSGYTGGGTIGEEMLRGRTAVMQKPFARADLLQRVRTLLDGNPV
ncbi:MAG TPA: ATP-binding protein [Gemmatimonadaceae bacterium]|nr:ATP-binding protein [Gemmatimonadaceae bacterium]